LPSDKKEGVDMVLGLIKILNEYSVMEANAQTPALTQAPAVATPSPAFPPYDFKISKDAQEWLQTLSPGMFDNYKQLEGTWNHPMTQFSITLVRDPQFRTSVSEIYGQHNMTTFYGYEALWIILVWILRAWRLSKSPTWLTRLWTQAWIAVVFWVGSTVVVPGILWGEAYRTVLSRLLKAVFQHFFT
jgi:hypothetical protein